MADTSPLRVIWSPRAVRDLAGIDSYISQFAPLAAQRFTARLVSTVRSLATHPNRGRPIGDGVRELVVVRPYLVVYEVTGDRVEILHIKHGAQRPA
ncbi:addiction module toxin RelE [Caulobacter sp. Root655]|jgi:addiction module RelE/StbE family toxin|uniref:type II toxin-antitoxin system RelE/ParE family toxin n=1 Tax=Caulobacter sp. Root655 TaxID=1736578 RepID=UPI0006FBE818|nr:type II toxin-antitoxin system RelE/ParE family toxin [Caulobacter sp. Root655]KRA57802.1 addiction module toxin RelE [Caulobacter sp. Root655]